MVTELSSLHALIHTINTVGKIDMSDSATLIAALNYIQTWQHSNTALQDILDDYLAVLETHLHILHNILQARAAMMIVSGYFSTKKDAFPRGYLVIDQWRLQLIKECKNVESLFKDKSAWSVFSTEMDYDPMTYASSPMHAEMRLCTDSGPSPSAS